MKLVHAADIHLDSPMHGLAAYDTAPVGELRLATRVALRNLVDLTIAERADVLLIAGDLYDGDWDDYATGALFVREAQRLAEAGVRVALVTGNHDARSRITRSLRLPDNVSVLPVDAPGTVVYEDLGLAVHGQGYATQAVLDDLSAAYPPPLGGLLNVGLLHTSADGRPGHERYAPCRVDRLAAHGYDYWALGHVHERELLHADPPILFPGCLQGRHVRETGPKGATVVVAGSAGQLELTEHVLDHVRWAVCDVDATELDDVDEVLGAVGEALRDAVDAADGRLLAARVRVIGASPAHSALVRAGAALDWEVRSVAGEVAGDAAWVERVAVRTVPEREVSAEGDDVFAELVRSLQATVADDGAIDALGSELASLAEKLPAAVRADWDPTSPAVVRDLVEDLRHRLPPRLLEERP
ncbi:MAG: metallophosphoesterase [Conexibacter sp.]|nr:metallophosphoesterase [Conexibacter sp.]